MTEPSHPTKKRRAGPEDVEIGRKIRALRLERGLSQSGLADGIDLTFQQVQKYEKGATASLPAGCSALLTCSTCR
jgi:DNA-binding XRE family transcriptional regulator